MQRRCLPLILTYYAAGSSIIQTQQSDKVMGKAKVPQEKLASKNGILRVNTRMDT